MIGIHDPPTAADNTWSSRDDVVTMLDLASTLLRYRRVIVLFACTLSVAAALWSLSEARRYVASASFMPQSTEAASSGATAIARQFGIVGLGGESGTFSPQFYSELIRNPRIMQSVVTARYSTAGGNGTDNRTLLEIWNIPDASRSVMLAAAGRQLRESTSVSVSAETGVIQLAVTTREPGLSEQIVARFLDYLSEFNVETRQRQALEETEFVSERLEQVADSLRSAERELMTFLERNRFFANSPELVFEHDRLQRQVVHQQAMYSSLVQSLEGARVEAARDLPLLTIISGPADSAVPKARRTGLKAIVAFIVGLVLGITFSFLHEHLRRQAALNRVSSEEVRRLAREALHDLAYPLRLLRSRQ